MVTAAPVVVESRLIEEDTWQVEVYRRSEPDERGRVYKELVHVAQCADRNRLLRRVRKTYPKIVTRLDLTPAQSDLFAMG